MFEGLPGVSDIEVEGHIVRMRVSGPIGAVITAAAQHGIVDVVSAANRTSRTSSSPSTATTRSTRRRPMTTDAGVLTRPGPWSRIAGLGTIYGKTVRDSWRAALVVGGVASLFMIGTGAPYGFAPEFSTVELRQAFIAGLTSLPPALRGLLGEPINLETMGGFLSWRVGNFLPVLLGLWPVIALSGTLAGEAAKGSLDLLASTPQGRRTIALEKLAGHVTAVIARDAPAGGHDLDGRRGVRHAAGRRDPRSAALGQVALYGVMMLFVGGVAVRDGAVGRPDARDGVRAHRPVRELPHLQLRDAVAGHRGA